MSPLFTSTVSCFFCQSQISPFPRDPRSFRCPHCSCYNRYDADGEIISYEPAMHDEALNSRSFAKRASPSKDRLPTMYGQGPFCHTCQTNQMLLMNLMSNYLPPPASPEYEQRLSTLSEYREYLHLRYPPVCTTCLPSVQEEIQKKDEMARSKALGGWLNESKGREKQRKVSSDDKKRGKVGWQMAVWRIRGCLWVGTLTAVVLGNATVAFGHHIPQQLAVLQPALPAIVLLSIFWTAWDPTYQSYQKDLLQGRGVLLRGKNKYITLQMMAWISRLVTSTFLALSWFRPHLDYLQISYDPPSSRSRTYCMVSLALEIYTSICSFIVLHLQRPPTIRLIYGNTHKLSAPVPNSTPISRASTPLPTSQVPTGPDLFSSLSLSSKPIISKMNPIFGLPSLVSTSRDGLLEEDPDSDAMDWMPTSPSFNDSCSNGKIHGKQPEEDGSWLRPQRFFPPEQPTGLESLFARTRLSTDDDVNGRPRGRSGERIWNWGWVYGMSLIPLAGFAFKAWEGRMRAE